MLDFKIEEKITTVAKTAMINAPVLKLKQQQHEFKQPSTFLRSLFVILTAIFNCFKV